MNAIENWNGPFPDGWGGGKPITKFRGGDFIHLYRVSRPCASCGNFISLDVTKAALLGTRKNAGLLLRNCPACREARKNGGVGSRGGKSRPVAEGGGVQPAMLPDETTAIHSAETLVMANHTMKEELAGLYVQLAELRTRLAQYELPGAMRAVSENKLPWG